jgi:biotin carboxylase
MRNVLFVAPFPLETTLRFVRAVAALKGVRLFGVVQELPKGADAGLFVDVVQVKDALETRQLVEAVSLLNRRHGAMQRVIGVLEPLQVQLAAVRQAFGLQGVSVDTAELFRDKAKMKDRLRHHGLPCARHQLLTSRQDAEAFIRQVGFPIVIKPPAGMGAKNTWRIQNFDALATALHVVQPSTVRPVLAEEFLRGQEYSYETVTIDGQVRFESISRYYPGPLEVTETPWVQWVCVLPRVMGPEFDDARALGRQAISALGLGTGVTHMEWFRRDDGSLAIGEIAARPPGANIVRMMGYAHDTDLYRAWALAVVDDQFEGPWPRRYAVGCAFLRGQGQGRVARISGVEQANRSVGHVVAESKLPQVGQPKSDSYEGDGYVIVRHEDTEMVKKAMTHVIETIRVEYT